jgi:hypothetical protein
MAKWQGLNQKDDTMRITSWARRHRLWTAITGVIVLLGAAAVGVWFLVLRTPATRVDLSQALRIYRQDQGSGAARAGAPLPPSGVYRYRTTGGEQLSLAGISRSFPDESEMIVTDSGSCATMKWEPIQQHTEGLVECPQKNGAITIASAPSFEDIAGISSTSDVRCPNSTYLVPPDPSDGLRWRKTCHSAGQPVVFSGDIIGLSSVNVAGTRVPALHLRLTLTFSGSEIGTNPNNYWISPEDGLILRQNETVNVSQKAGPLGSVQYNEEMSIALQSLNPVR